MADDYAKGWERGWADAMVEIQGSKATKAVLLMRMADKLRRAEEVRKAAAVVRTKPVKPEQVFSDEW